ncbi:hypothetical protein HDU89_003497 [Geranomyces variabilis]|nr:hypothetical protein HDU89_003497 [Geranomyces variabilis]
METEEHSEETVPAATDTADVAEAPQPAAPEPEAAPQKIDNAMPVNNPDVPQESTADPKQANPPNAARKRGPKINLGKSAGTGGAHSGAEAPRSEETAAGPSPSSTAQPVKPRSARQPRPKGNKKPDTQAANGSAQTSETQAANSNNREESAPGATAPTTTAAPQQPRVQPYVNPNRVATGGLDKKRLTEEELDEKMAAIRAKNEALKQKQEAARADEERFNQIESAERARRKLEDQERRAAQAAQRAAERVRVLESRRVQEQLRREREENAARKAKSFSGREWDVGKVVGGSDTGRNETSNWNDTSPRASGYRQRGGRGGSTGEGGGRRYMDRDRDGPGKPKVDAALAHSIKAPTATPAAAQPNADAKPAGQVAPAESAGDVSPAKNWGDA